MVSVNLKASTPLFATPIPSLVQNASQALSGLDHLCPWQGCVGQQQTPQDMALSEKLEHPEITNLSCRK